LACGAAVLGGVAALGGVALLGGVVALLGGVVFVGGGVVGCAFAGGRGVLAAGGSSAFACTRGCWDLVAGWALVRLGGVGFGSGSVLPWSGGAGAGGGVAFDAGFAGDCGAGLRGVDFAGARCWRVDGVASGASVPVPVEVLSSVGGRKVTGGGAFAGFFWGVGWSGVLNAGFDVRGRRCVGSFSSMPREPSRVAPVSPVGRRCGPSISADFDDRRGPDTPDGQPLCRAPGRSGILNRRWPESHRGDFA